MKKVAVIFAFVMILSSSAFASPLMDYSAGKTSIDLTFRNSGIEETTPGWVQFFPRKSSNVDAAVTVGLGNNFAVQYRDFTTKSGNRLYPELDGDTDSVYEKYSVQEFNAMYKLNKNVAAYVGTVKGKLNFVDLTDSQWSGGGSKTFTQFGLVGVVPISSKTDIFANVSVGKDYKNYEVGVSYAINSNLDFNVSYRQVKTEIFIPGPDGGLIKHKIDGLGFGATYKF